ncbi:MAG: hypothetical protein ACLP00_14710 [Terracidiphilus sp.]
MSAETAVLTIDLLFCIAAAMALASINWAQPAPVAARDSTEQRDQTGQSQRGFGERTSERNDE